MRIWNRGLYSGFIAWAVSISFLILCWYVILSVSKSAAGTWPLLLTWWLYMMYGIAIVWSVAAALIFRRDAQRQSISSHRSNLISIGMICVALLTVIMFQVANVGSF